MRQFIVGVVGIAAIIIVAACSSESEATGTKRTNAKGNTVSDASTSDVDIKEKEANPPPAASAPPVPPTGACSAKDGAEACFECCESKSPGGAQIYDQAFRECLCKPAACAVQCAQSECAATPTDPTPGDACSTCIENQAECEEKADQACAASAVCTALLQCLGASGCEAAEPDGGT